MSARKKILVVDDNSANLSTCKTILKDSYDVFTALSATSMLALLKNITPDLIMLDVKMPGINGYEAARILKNEECYKDIPVIFVTALSDVESEMEGLELGAVDYISKPYFPPILIRRIETHLSLVEKTKQLEAASQAKTNFLANMSHEMRTPLTAVLGLTELTLNTVQFDEETYLNLIKVYRAGETLLRLINDILDMSKIEADRFVLNPVDYELSAMLGDTITQSVLYKEEKPIEFVLDINPDLPKSLYGDELRIKQILNNLLSNAFKFTEEGTVELGIRCEKDENAKTVMLTAWVSDTGIGIRTEDIGKLFTTYYRMEEDIAGKTSVRRTEGTGLGLYISKKVAGMMGGSIKVESEYGKGSRFTVQLKQEYTDDAVIGDEVTESLKNLRFYADEFKAADKTRLNMSYACVLVADDNATNLDVARSLLELYGIKVDCANSGQQAIDAVRSGKMKYDAIFMDHIMPEMDGIEATRIIREEIDTDYAKTVPIIALTANAITGNEEMFLRKGFQAFLPKPIELVRLESVLRKWVRNEEAEALLDNQTITINKKVVRNRILLEDIPGLDVNEGISRFGFNEVSYIKTLQSFAENTKPLLDTISNVIEDELGKYATILHGIKGSSRGIYAQSIGNDAETLEKAAKSGDFAYVTNNNPKFIEEVKQLIADIEEAYSKTAISQKPNKDKPDAGLLRKFLEACERFDIDEMDTAMEEIDRWSYTEDDGLSTWLRQNLEQGKFNDIKERLSALLS